MTELIWDGKYDANGRRVAPLRVALPFQTVETVNESAHERQRSLDLFGGGGDPEWRNRLIWGDKKYVLPSLLPELAGKVDLIYIDPPFDTGADFSFQVQIEDEQFTKEPSIIEQKAYRDTWGRGLDGYLQWFSECAVVLHELLSSTGTLYVHLDWHVVHFVKALLDEQFGPENFINEVVWKRADAHNDVGQGAKSYGKIHDSILVFVKQNTYTWNTQFLPLPDSTADKWYRHTELGTGRRYNMADMTARKAGGDTRYEWNGVVPPPGRYWAYSRRRMEELHNSGRIVYANTGMPYLKRYLDESRGVSLQDLWTDISMLRGFGTGERLGYPTQKPEPLLERIMIPLR